jgi:DNA-directed RNA polymerase subunit RPC12/RpoP
MLDVRRVERIIHCRHCGMDNPVATDVIGKLCDQCGQDIYTPEFEAEIAAQPPTAKATADRTGDVLRVVCPHCGFKNEFPEFDMVDIFLCDDCGKPVAVEEPVQ